MENIQQDKTILHNSSIKEEKKKEERRNVSNNMSSNDAFLVVNSSDELTESDQSSKLFGALPKVVGEYSDENANDYYINYGADLVAGIDPNQGTTYEWSSFQASAQLARESPSWCDQILGMAITIRSNRDSIICPCHTPRSDPISFPHQEPEMNLTNNSNKLENDGLDPIFSNHQIGEMNDVINSQTLETIDSDPSELVASYGCKNCGVVTRVQLGTPVASINPCINCGKKNFTRAFDPADPNVESAIDEIRVEEIEAQKPMWHNVYIRVCVKCNPNDEEQLVKCSCKNPKMVTREIFVKDDNRGLGSIDPETIMGMTPPSAIFVPSGTTEDGKYILGKFNPQVAYAIDQLTSRIHMNRVDENADIFKREVPMVTIPQNCEMPIELKDQHMEMPEMKRNVRFLVNIPETSLETSRLAFKRMTRNSILVNKAKKADRILRSEFSIEDWNFSVNTCNKYLGVKPLLENITYEKLSSAMKAWFHFRKENNTEEMARYAQIIIASSKPKEMSSEFIIHETNVVTVDGQVMVFHQASEKDPMIEKEHRALRALYGKFGHKKDEEVVEPLIDLPNGVAQTTP